MKKKIAAAVLAAAMGLGFSATAAGAAPAPGKDACKNGGWETAMGTGGETFKNQGQCVSFVNGGGTLA